MPSASRAARTPNKSPFFVLFRILDVQAFEEAVSRKIASRLPEGQEKGISLRQPFFSLPAV